MPKEIAPKIQESLSELFNKTLTIQQPAVTGYVKQVRKWATAHSTKSDHWRDGSPKAALRILDRQYLSALAAGGAGTGAAAAVPGMGTAAAVGLSLVEASSSLEATVLYILAVAEIHGIEVDDLERRRTLVLSILLGNGGVKIVEKAADRTGRHLGKKIVESIPMQAIRNANKILGKNFITKYGTKQGILVLGKAVPFGLGAAIGGAGNYVIGRGTIATTHAVFGEPPEEWPHEPLNGTVVDEPNTDE